MVKLVVNDQEHEYRGSIPTLLCSMSCCATISKLNGAKFGAGRPCGSCTVLVDDNPVFSLNAGPDA